jgi:hypothetical protein
MLMTLAIIVGAMTAADPGAAQQVTGVPGSPSATTTIKGDQLLPSPPPFGGKIERNALQSTPWWPPRVVPPKGAPNILLIMTDDQGFAFSSRSRSSSPCRRLGPGSTVRFQWVVNTRAVYRVIADDCGSG